MDAQLAQTLAAPTEEDKKALAKHIFDQFVASKPSRQQFKAFMTERAKAYFAQDTATPRAERRLAYRHLGKAMQKKALNGELE